jgi:hypothetical protein
MRLKGTQKKVARTSAESELYRLKYVQTCVNSLNNADIQTPSISIGRRNAHPKHHAGCCESDDGRSKGVVKREGQVRRELRRGLRLVGHGRAGPSSRGTNAFGADGGI